MSESAVIKPYQKVIDFIGTNVFGSISSLMLVLMGGIFGNFFRLIRQPWINDFAYKYYNQAETYVSKMFLSPIEVLKIIQKKETFRDKVIRIITTMTKRTFWGLLYLSVVTGAFAGTLGLVGFVWLQFKLPGYENVARLRNQTMEALNMNTSAPSEDVEEA